MLDITWGRARAFALIAVGALFCATAVMAQPVTAGAADPLLIEDLVAANRILVSEGVLDGWGHVSVRHNRDPNRYLMARGSAPELVTAADILEFDLDSRAVNTKGFELYSERYIHGEIYKARPDVMAIVHIHAPPLIPFGVTGLALRPIYAAPDLSPLGVDRHRHSFV